MSYFIVERNEKSIDIGLSDELQYFYSLTYDDLRKTDCSSFVNAIMECADIALSGEYTQTLVTLIGDDDVFIWSIIMDYTEDNTIKYVFVDWKKDGKSYRYEPLDK